MCMTEAMARGPASACTGLRRKPAWRGSRLRNAWRLGCIPFRYRSQPGCVAAPADTPRACWSKVKAAWRLCNPAQTWRPFWSAAVRADHRCLGQLLLDCGTAQPPPPAAAPTRRPPAAAPSAGAELQSAAAFLNKGAAPAGTQLARAPTQAPAPLLLPPPPPPALSAPPQGRPALAAPALSAAAAAAWPASPALPDSGAGTQGGDSGDADADVSALLGLLLPQQQHVPAAERPARTHTTSCFKAVAPPRPAATLPAGASSPPAVQRSHAKVLSWLSASASTAEPAHASAAGHDAAPTAWRARAVQPAATAAQRPAAGAPTPRLVPAPLLLEAVGPPPANRSSHLLVGPPPRRLALVRPACPGCGRPDAGCCCSGVGGAPLRLLRPRPSGSPARPLGALQAGMQAPHQPCTAQPLPGPAAVTIGSIQTAFFGAHACGSEQQAAARQPTDIAKQQLQLPPQPRQALPGSGPALVAARGGNGAQQDLWHAYLATRQASCSGELGPALMILETPQCCCCIPLALNTATPRCAALQVAMGPSPAVAGRWPSCRPSQRASAACRATSPPSFCRTSRAAASAQRPARQQLWEASGRGAQRATTARAARASRPAALQGQQQHRRLQRERRERQGQDSRAPSSPTTLFSPCRQAPTSAACSRPAWRRQQLHTTAEPAAGSAPWARAAGQRCSA